MAGDGWLGMGGNGGGGSLLGPAVGATPRPPHVPTHALQSTVVRGTDLLLRWTTLAHSLRSPCPALSCPTSTPASPCRSTWCLSPSCCAPTCTNFKSTTGRAATRPTSRCHAYSRSRARWAGAGGGGGEAVGCWHVVAGLQWAPAGQGGMPPVKSIARCPRCHVRRCTLHSAPRSARPSPPPPRFNSLLPRPPDPHRCSPPWPSCTPWAWCTPT